MLRRHRVVLGPSCPLGGSEAPLSRVDSLHLRGDNSYHSSQRSTYAKQRSPSYAIHPREPTACASDGCWCYGGRSGGIPLGKNPALYGAHRTVTTLTWDHFVEPSGED